MVKELPSRNSNSKKKSRFAVAALVILLIPYFVFAIVQFSTPVSPYLIALREPVQVVAQAPAGKTILVSKTIGGAFRNITAAVAEAQPGDTVLIQPGIYHEQVNISKPWITIMGADSRRVILDGNFTLKDGVKATHSYGIVVKDLTARNYLDDGVFFFKSDHWLMDHIIGVNNRAYELFALSSRWGTISNSVATGGGDSGLYIGETHDCNCLIDNSTAYGNTVGYSGTRVDGVTIRDSKFIGNAVGVAPNTLLPDFTLVLTGQWDNPFFASNHTIESNVIENNNNRTVQGVGIAASYGVPIGTGISLAGAYGNTIRNNVISGNSRWGVAQWYFLAPPISNNFESNKYANNGQDMWSDGTNLFGCSTRETPNGDVPPNCNVPALLRLTPPNPLKDIQLLLNLGRPGYVVETVLGRFSFGTGLLTVVLLAGSQSFRIGKEGLAGRRYRFLSAFYDCLLVGVVYTAVASSLIFALGSAAGLQDLVNNVVAFTLLLAPLSYFIFIAVWFLYGLITDLLGRKTLGRSIFDLRTVGADGRRLSSPRILVKNLLIYVGCLSFGLTWALAILLKGRTLSEIICGAYVSPE